MPNFLIVGSMKCGTSALYRGVVSHDDVFGARGKELHYFDQNYEKGQEWYESHFTDHGGATAVGEGTPYLGDRVAMARIVRDLPDARFVAILRQPAERAYSHYWHNRRREREERPFMTAFSDDLGRDVEPARWMNYWRVGRYVVYLEELAASVGPNSIHVILDEDLRRERVNTLRGIWEHLGVDPSRGRTKIPERSLWRKAYRSTKNLIKGRNDDRSYPPVDAEMYNEVTGVYREDILRLQEFLKRDLSAWLRPR